MTDSTLPLTRTKSFIFWIPRVLTILFALFLGLFASDVFSEGLGFWDTAVALLMHLVPSFAVLLFLAIAWKWELVGAVVYALFGLLYVAAAIDHPTWILGISGPLFIISLLWLLGWLQRRKAEA